MVDQEQATRQVSMSGSELRDALVALHQEVAALAKQLGLDPDLVDTAADALKQLRLAVTLSADSSDELSGKIGTLRTNLVELMEAHGDDAPRQRALQRAAAFVSGAICELRPSLLT